MYHLTSRIAGSVTSTSRVGIFGLTPSKFQPRITVSDLVRIAGNQVSELGEAAMNPTIVLKFLPCPKFLVDITHCQTYLFDAVAIGVAYEYE